MNRFVVACFAALSLIACGGSGKSPTGPDFSAYIGTWEVAVPAIQGCFPAFNARFTVNNSDVANAGSGVMNVVSQWYFSTDPSTLRTVSGNFTQYNDTFAFVFQWNGSSFRIDGSGTSPTGSRQAVFSNPTGSMRTTFGASGPCNGVATLTHL